MREAKVAYAGVARRTRWRGLAIVMMAAIGWLAGCSDGGNDLHLLVVVADNEIRAEGVECAGARPYQYVHAGARFTLETEDGTELAEGELPSGRAENADPSIDWGVERIPTVCAMEVDIEGVAEHARYRLQLEDGPPLAFEARDSEDGRITLIVQ
jgi:hypothetical protein